MNTKKMLAAAVAMCGMLFSMPNASAKETCTQKQCKLLNQINETTRQDLVLDQTTLNVVNQINSTTRQDLAIDQEILDIVEQFACVTLISELPYTISEPGYYKLDCDLVFDPDYPTFAPPDQRAVQAAITITASNVHLDMGPHTLRQAIPANPSEQVPFCIGILVPDPLPESSDINAVGQESIYITGDNAIISDFSMYGIRVFAHTSDIEIDNLTVKHCGELASKALRPTVHIDSYSQPYLPHDQGVGAAFGPSYSVAGICLGESVGLGQGPVFFSDVSTTQLNVVNRMENVRLNKVNCLYNFMYGADVKLVTNLSMNDCHFDFTWSDEPGSNNSPAFPALIPWGFTGGDGQYGIFPNGNSYPGNLNVDVTNCTFNNTNYKGDYTTFFSTLTPGLSAFGCATVTEVNATYIDCEFNSSSCTFPSATGNNSLLGGCLTDGSENASYINCSFDGSMNLGSVEGFHSGATYQNELQGQGKNLKFINCTSNNHQSRTDLILPAPIVNTRAVVAFRFDHMRDLYMDTCEADNLFISGPASGGFNTGFAQAEQGSNSMFVTVNCIFKDCVASRIRAVNGGQAVGWHPNFASQSIGASFLYEDCESLGNQAQLSSVYTAWSNSTTYSVGALVSFSGVNYVSLVNSNLNLQPNTNPSQWSVINTSPAQWVSTTVYGLGAQVSFTDSTGHTNEYISTIANNVGNYPNAPGPGLFAVTPNWIQTNVYPTWKSGASYFASGAQGSIVGYLGVNYRSLVNNNVGNQPNTSPSQWSTTTNVTQGVACGFYTQLQTLASTDGPEIYRNCTASQNKGAPGPVNISGVNAYSAGFFVNAAYGNHYDSCIADENIYGFLISNSNSCVVKNCRAFNNTLSGVGEGFTDVGTGTVSSPTQSTSMFEGNSAYNNGNGTAHTGPNGNYNVWVNAGLTLRPPLLNCVNSAGTCAATDPSTYYANKHNLSSIK